MSAQPISNRKQIYMPASKIGRKKVKEIRLFEFWPANGARATEACR